MSDEHRTLKCCGRTATSWWHRTYCNPTLSSKKALPTESVNRVRGGLTGRRPIQPGQKVLEFECYHCGSLRLSCCNPDI